MSSATSLSQEIEETTQSQDSQSTVAITTIICECDGCQWNRQDPVPDHQEPCTCWELDTDEDSQQEDTSDTPRCPGCAEDQPNQLAHVGPNGCLGDYDF